MSTPASGTHTPMFLLSVESQLVGVDTPGNQELLRRIHACVAACEGISTEELEQGVVRQMQELLRQVLPLLQDRRERTAA